MKRLIILTIFTVFLLVGCDNGKQGEYIESNVRPNMKIYAKDADVCYYYYVIDKNTDVVYIQYENVYNGGITPAYNADGTIMTADQLELE